MQIRVLSNDSRRMRKDCIKQKSNGTVVLLLSVLDTINKMLLFEEFGRADRIYITVWNILQTLLVTCLEQDLSGYGERSSHLFMNQLSENVCCRRIGRVQSWG
jgi:hypothetical protein